MLHLLLKELLAGWNVSILEEQQLPTLEVAREDGSVGKVLAASPRPSLIPGTHVNSTEQEERPLPRLLVKISKIYFLSDRAISRKHGLRK